MKIGVIIPAFNAGKTIGRIIDSVKEHIPSPVIVVDDGSVDSTCQIAIEHEAIVLSHHHNKGKGEALKTGFKKILYLDCQAALTIDADGQHNPQFIPKFIASMESGAYDIIIGSRMGDIRNMPFHRILSNKITSGMIALRIGQRVRDSQSGYRLLKADIVKKVRLNTSHYDTESELLIKAGLSHHRIGFIDVDTTYSDEPSSIRVMTDTWRFIKLYLRSFTW